MEPVIELVEAVAVLGRFPALAGVTLSVDRGEIVLLRGANGAGKTTLLRLCAGLLGLERGSGRVLGCDLATNRADVRTKVGLLGHTNGLYSDLTVRENVRFWGSTVGATGEEIQSSMTRLGLDGRLASIKVGRLSAGQKRRTALACLVARRAELWLLDEPHAGLDAAGRDELDATLRAAVAAGATVVVASHELERAGNLATRVIEIAGGLAQERGAGGTAPPAANAAAAGTNVAANAAAAGTNTAANAAGTNTAAHAAGTNVAAHAAAPERRSAT